MNSERDIQAAVRLALGSVPGLVLWRNNVGVATHVDRGGRPVMVRYGLAPGSADLVGCYHGRFVALEIKGPSGRMSPDQERWLACVRSVGGFACVVRSVDEARAALERCALGADG